MKVQKGSDNEVIAVCIENKVFTKFTKTKLSVITKKRDKNQKKLK